MAVWLLGRPLYGPNCLKWPFLGPKMHIIPLYRMVLHGIALHLMILHSLACHCIVLYGVAWCCIVGFGARAVSRKTPTYFILVDFTLTNTETSRFVRVAKRHKYGRQIDLCKSFGGLQ